MSTEKNNIREDKASSINPDEANAKHPAKELQAQEKIDIKQSELGREQGQTPADEHIESFSQIDEKTKSIQEKHQMASDSTSQNENSDNDAGTGYMNDANSNTDRDTGNSTSEGWDAESSRTGRHK